VETHLRSALGLGSGEINRYQKLTRRADRVAVFKKYLENFAEHRISPYSFYDYAPIQVRFAGTGTNEHAEVDFSRFDPWARRWLGKAGFNTFQLPLQGMGGGTFYQRYAGELGGFKAGSPEYARLLHDYLRQVEQHLRENDWLNKAFTYWFDEPAQKDFAFVVDGMKRLKAAAPGIKRMLTKEPEPELIGNVDIWCGLTPQWTRVKVRARRAAGEEVWWYICTGPKAPYLTEFIDHPGTELRLWPWQSWQYDVSGILIWSTVYWTSPEAYPDSLQDPWQDPMSWVNGYGTPAGTRRPWGNGDGRFLYPPRRNPNTANQPDLNGPINSIRWEALRDGMEDYEYFWLLNEETGRAAHRPGAADLIQTARQLLVVPANISKDLTHFTSDPRLLLAHRDRMARMIERLRRE
jgi:Glycoside hydrolase 123, catalytic domain